MKTMRLTVLGMVSLCLLVGCGSSSSTKKQAAKKIVIGTQEMPNDEGVAKALKYFESETGTKVSYKKFDSGRDVATALMTGDIDFGLLGSCPAALSIAQGAKVQYIWTHEVLGSAESLVVKSGITKASDLKGKTIATPFASTAHYSLLSYLKENHISTKSLKLLDMQPSEIYSAWTSGQIDGAYVWEPTLSKMKNHKVLKTSAQMAKDGYMTANVEMVTEKFAKDNPKLVKGYVKALDKAVKLYREKPNQAIGAVASSLEIGKSSAKFQMAGSQWLTAKEQVGSDYMGTSSKKGKVADNLYDIAKFLKAQKSITSVPSKETFTSAIHPEYAEAVKD